MKTLRRNISFNLACSILEANHWGIDSVVVSKDRKYDLFKRQGKTVARYNEDKGKLEVIS
jgi:hypothetical protein